MKILSLYSLKGGVGKSTASVNLAYASALRGSRTLLVDLDPLGSSSFCLQVHARKSHGPDALIKGGKALTKQARATDYPFLDVLPPSAAYRDLESMIEEKKHSSHRLEKSLGTLEGVYDLVVIDTPPAMGLIGKNVLISCDLLVVPVIPTVLAIQAYEQLLEQVEGFGLNRRKVHPFISMMDQRKRLHRSVADALQNREEALHTTIPYRSEIEQMTVHMQPLGAQKPKGVGSQAFTALFSELAVLLGM